MFRLGDAAGVYGGGVTVGQFAQRLRCRSCGQVPAEVMVMNTDDPHAPMQARRIVLT